MIKLALAALGWSVVLAVLARWLARQPWGARVVVALIGLSGVYFAGLIGLLAYFAEVFS